VVRQLGNAQVEVAVVLSPLFLRISSAARRTGVREIVWTGVQEYMPPPLRLLYPIKARREGQWVNVPRQRGVHAFGDVLRSAAPQPVANSPDDPAVYMFTGGTTALPKAVVLTHRNLVCNVLQSAAWDSQHRTMGERAMGVLPFFHSYGMTAVMNVSLWIGAPIILIPRFDQHLVLRALAKWRPTLFHGVPTTYIALLNAPGFRSRGVGSIRTCISGAMGLPGEVQRKWEEACTGRLVEGYGLTEASPITHCNPILGPRKAGSIGLPYPDTEARIVDPESGAVLRPGEVGELAIRGPQVMRGYLHSPEETARTLRNGWLFTGDMAWMDADGFFYIVDRRKEMINVGGLKVFPREVEEVLYQHPAVKEAAVVGSPDPVKGEVVKAFVVATKDHHASADEIVAFCRDRLAPHKVPHAMEFRDALPKTLVGKVLRRVLAEEARVDAK